MIQNFLILIFFKLIIAKKSINDQFIAIENLQQLNNIDSNLTHEDLVLKKLKSYQLKMENNILEKNLIKINRLVQNENFFSNITVNKSLKISLKLNFSAELLGLLEKSNIKCLQIKIRKFMRKNYNYKLNTNLIEKINESNLSIIHFSSNRLDACWFKKNDEFNTRLCYKSFHNEIFNHSTTDLSNNLYLIDFLSFNIKKH